MYRQSFRNRRRFSPRPRFAPKALNPSLFVNKPQVTEQEVKQEIQHTFSDFLISDLVKRNISEKGYVAPTPIQDKVIPAILEGRDVIGIANTGTGKTGAFLIPLINKVFFNRSQKVLIIAPTRELAVQIQEECVSLAKGMNIFTTLAIGGASIHQQASTLRRNPNFVIGTPGRLKDLSQQGKLHLFSFNNTVLDEVDRMFDMGFINDITFLIGKLPKTRQSLFFSATIPAKVAPLMQKFLQNPVTISVKTHETAQTIEQDVVKLQGRNKIDVLHDLLSQRETFKKVLVFGRTKWGIEKLSKLLVQRGFGVAAIHGNKNQNQRQRSLEQFKKGEITILLATDIASRGLDIPDISHVINYDPPQSYEDYVHRVGRTGRIEKKGIALTFVA